jgi:hypothetical protein
MKKLVKIAVVGTVVLAVATVGLLTARAAGWREEFRPVRGFATRTVPGRPVVTFPAPAGYYVCPQSVYVAPYCAPCAPAPVIVQAPPVYCAPAPVVYPVICPPVRVPVVAVRPHYIRR